MIMGAWGLGRTRLPYDAEVEYLESTGDGAYIDTGVAITDNDFVISCDMASTVQAQSRQWIGYFSTYSGESAMSTRVISYSTIENSLLCGYRRRSGGAQTRCNVSSAIGGITSRGVYRLSNGKLELVKNSAVVATYPLAESGFGDQDTSTMTLLTAKMKCYGFSITHNGVLVRDMITVRFTNEYGQTEGAMYDRVSGRLFRNQGTGSFVIGRDTNPISARSYVNDGLIAMWDGIENAGWGVHDAAATTWLDIVGGKILTLNGSAVFGENYMGTSDDVSGAIGDFNLNATYMELVMSVGRTADWFSVIDGLNGKWVWGEPENYDSSDGGLSWMYWGGATNPRMTGTIQVAMSFDGSVCQFNGTQKPIDMSYADDAIGPFAIFGNVENIGEERCCRGKCFSARFYSAIPNASQRSANLEIDRARFNLP